MKLLRRKKPHKSRDGRIVLTMQDHQIDTVLDIGANVGQTGKALRENGYKGRIVSFEPIPRAHEALCAAASSDSLWTVADRTAVGHEVGEIELHEAEASDMSSILPAEEELLETLPKTAYVNSWATPMTTVEKIIEAHTDPQDKVYVKIDTQGYEKQVLDGIGGAWDRITGLQLEMSLFSLYKGEALFSELTREILDQGFEPFLMLETNFSRKLVRQLQVDGVFYR